MNIPVLLTTILVASSAIAQNDPKGLQSYPVPVAPPGENSAAYPLPRLDWIERVKLNNEQSHAIAGTIELIFDGDSITDGWHGKTTWTARYGKLNAFNFGIGGDRTQNVLWRLSQGQVDGMHPKVIALMIGTNNLFNNTEEQIADGVKKIVAEYQKRCPSAVILLQAVFPRYEKADNPYRAKIKTINQIISKLGDGEKVIYIDFGDKLLNPDGTMSRDIMPDFLHPNEKGYQIWADAIAPVINKFFPEAQTQQNPPVQPVAAVAATSTDAQLPANAGSNLALNKKHDSSAPNTGGWDLGLVDGSWVANSAHTYATDNTANFPKTVTIDLETPANINLVFLGVPAYGSTKTIAVSVSTTLFRSRSPKWGLTSLARAKWKSISTAFLRRRRVMCG
jgi:lysophospholipase L1-like esterase